MRWIWAPLALLSLSGCALPPALTVASLALDVSSYALTGKGTIDHGISLVAQQDCAVLQLTQGHLCKEPERYEEQALAALTPLPSEPQSARQPTAGLAPAQSEATQTAAVWNGLPSSNQTWIGPAPRLLPTANPSIFVAEDYAQSLTAPAAPTNPPAQFAQRPAALPPQSASVLVITGNGLAKMPQRAFLPSTGDAEG